MKRLLAAMIAAAVMATAAMASAAAAAPLPPPSPGAYLGYSVAVSGSTVVAGAPQWDNYRGEVYVYVRHGAKWSQQALLRLGRATTGWQFGASVAISGSTIVVGASGANASRGLAYVYIRTGTRWHRQAVLRGKSQKDASFGAAVGIAGSMAVVGAPGQSVAGAVLVFTRHGSTWSRPVYMPGPGPTSGAGEFGDAVSISGTKVAVGWPELNSVGTARVYVQVTPQLWYQQAYLNGAAADFHFGQSVAISGAVTVVGAPDGDPENSAAYIFTWSKGAWHQRAALHGFTTDSEFGNSVGASGATVIVGAPEGGSAREGTAYLYQESGRKWGQVASLAAPNSDGDLFGLSGAISGGTAVVGAPDMNGHGAVFVYVRSGTKWVQQAQL